MATDNIVKIPVHDTYAFARSQIMVARDCMEGEDRIKSKGYTYLPHPSQVDTTSAEQVARYSVFKAGAEFDDFPASSRRALLGKMRIDSTIADLPTQIEYLEEDADGDGVPLSGLIENASDECLLANWCVLVADYAGLGDVDLTSVSKAEAESAKPRAKIKIYERENVVNWSFTRINGAMQLSFIALQEVGVEFDPLSMEENDVVSYLILAIDENGNYYQQKIVYTDNGINKGEPSYVSINGQPMTFIPVEFASLRQTKRGELPKEMGYLYPICLKTLHRYRVSAVYKEVQRNLAPSTFTKGWQEGDIDIFKQANGQREYIATGPSAVNNLPNNVDVEILSAATDMSDYQWYFEKNEKEIQALGGSVNTQAQAMTATEADIQASDQNAMLETLCTNLERAFKRICEYCGMFEGVDADVEITMPRDFATPKLSVDEVRVLIELKMQNVISMNEFHRKLDNGGWLIEDAETIIAEMEMETPEVRPVDNVNNIEQTIPNDSVNQQQTDEAVPDVRTNERAV